MPKGYWIAMVDVTDPATYQRYREALAAPFARHGARFVIRGGPQEVVEGAAPPRSVVIEFPSLAAAKACYDDPEYREARKIREAASTGTIVIVEGYDG